MKYSDFASLDQCLFWDIYDRSHNSCLRSLPIHYISPGAKGLKWRFFAHESVQAEFGLKL